jgi:hypothetical protein
MHIQLSPQTVEAVAYVISGGSARDPEPPIGVYRQGWRIEQYMKACGIEMAVGGSSRYNATVAAITSALHRTDADEILRKVIERAADPRDFANEPARLHAVVEYLNKYLVFDGLQLRQDGRRVRLLQSGASASVIEAFAETLGTIDFDTVARDLERALRSAEEDPEDAVTAACSVVESLCRSVLIELGHPLPDKRDVTGLYRAVREPLGLSPNREDLPSEIAADVRTVLGGISAIVQGIGALRTHGGDAHGREKGFRRIDPRIARLAIHSASSVALFLVETWQQKFPSKPLRPH